MGQYQLILIALIVLPVIVLFVMRTSATMVFLSLCLGYTVGNLLGSDIHSFTNLFMPQWGLSDHYISIGLLLIPCLLTALFMTGTNGGTRRLLNLIPSVAVGALLTLLIVPLLSPNMTAGITHTGLWHTFSRLQSLIVGGGAIVSLLFLWLQRPTAKKEDSSKKRSD